MSFRVKKIKPGEYPDLATAFNAVQEDTIIVLAPGNYPTTTSGIRPRYHKLVVVGEDTNNAKNRTNIQFNQDQMYLYTPYGILFENLTFSEERGYIDIVGSAKCTFNRIWINLTDNYPNYRVKFRSGSNFSIFQNCHFSDPGYAYTPDAVFYSEDSHTPLGIFDIKNCTSDWIHPQFYTYSRHDWELMTTSGIVSYNSPSSPPLATAQDLRGEAQVLATAEIHPNIADNVLSPLVESYWEAPVGSVITMDLKSDVGVGEIVVDLLENQVSAYDIYASSDLSVWHKVVGISPSNKTSRTHDLFGYSCRYLRLVTRNCSEETLRIAQIIPYSNPMTEDFVEPYFNFGPTLGQMFYSGKITEPLVVSGTIKNTGLPLAEHELLIYSANIEEPVDTVLSKPDGTFDWEVPEHLSGHYLEIFGVHEGKKLQISSLIAPERTCSGEYPQICSEQAECQKVGGWWRNQFCWPQPEPCESPYFNCEDRVACEAAGGEWWDTTKSCWGTDNRKVIDGNERIMSKGQAFINGGYYIGDTLYPSDFRNFSDTFEGVDGDSPDGNKWTQSVRRYDGSDNDTVATALINNNKLKFDLTTNNATFSVYGIESQFILYAYYGGFEFDISDISMSGATGFFVGMQGYSDSRGTWSNEYLKGCYIDATNVQYMYRHGSTISRSSPKAHGGNARIRIAITYQNLTVWVKPSGGSWTLTNNISTTSAQMRYQAKIAMRWESTVANSKSISISNFELLAGQPYPKPVAGIDSNVPNSRECQRLNGQWDPDTRNCCPAVPYVTDFSTYSAGDNPNLLKEGRLYLNTGTNNSGRIIDEALQLNIKYEPSVGNSSLVENGGITIHKVPLASEKGRFEFIVEAEDIYANYGSYCNSTNYIVYAHIGQYTPNNSSYNHYMRVKIEYRGGYDDWRYCVERRYAGSWSTWGMARVGGPPPERLKLRLYRAYEHAGCYGYYWDFDTEAWVQISTQDLGVNLLSQNYDFPSCSWYVGNYDTNYESTDYRYAREQRVSIKKITIKTDFADCGSCGDHPIKTCANETDCEPLANWQNETRQWGDSYAALTYCSTKEAPSCATDLSLCDGELDCVSSGKYWWDGACHETPVPTCKAEAARCVNEVECVSNGHYWYNDTCNITPEPECENTPTLCMNQIACEDSGYYWYNGACQSGNPCTAANPERCLSEETCEGVDKFWYNGKCNSLNAPTEHTLSTMDLRPQFYINFNLDSLREVTSEGRLFTTTGSPQKIRTLKSPGGTNFSYLFNESLSGDLDSIQTAVPIYVEDDFTFETIFNSGSVNEDPFELSPFSLMGTTESDGNFISATVSQLLLRTSAGEFALGLPFSRTVNTWYHLVLVRKNGTAQVYLNGQPGQTLILDGSLNLTKIAGNARGIFRGSIDEIVVYSYAFDLTRILTRSSYVISNT